MFFNCCLNCKMAFFARAAVMSMFMLFIAVYLTLNIVGTIYYTKLPSDTQTQKGVRGGGLATVILGWIGMPFLNLYSPIAYTVQK